MSREENATVSPATSKATTNLTEAEDEKSEEGDHTDQNNAIEEATIEEIVEDDNETGRDADIDLD